MQSCNGFVPAQRLVAFLASVFNVVARGNAKRNEAAAHPAADYADNNAQDPGHCARLHLSLGEGFMPAVMAFDFSALLGPLVVFISLSALLFLRFCKYRVAEGHLLLLPGCNRLTVRPDHSHLLLLLHHHLLLRLHHLLLRMHRRTVGSNHHHHRLLGLVCYVDALTHARIHHHLRRNLISMRRVHHHWRLALRCHRLHYDRLALSDFAHLHTLLIHIYLNQQFIYYY